MLDWGDESTPVNYVPDMATCSSTTTKDVNINHIYPKPGVYLVTLRAGDDPKKFGQKQDMYFPIVRYKAVSVGMSGVPFRIDPPSGQAPLSVVARFSLSHPSCTSYLIDWGDGSQPYSFEASNFTCAKNPKDFTIRHTYLYPGKYIVTFRAGQKPLAQTPVREKFPIYVEELTGDKQVIDIHPERGKAPLTVTVSLAGAYGLCSSYEIDWGDGSMILQKENAAFETSEFNTDEFVFNFAQDTGTTTDQNCTGPFKEDFTHTYVAPGVYPLKIKFGKGSLSEIDPIIHIISVSP